MSLQMYIKHFKDMAAGKIPKNQEFYIVDPQGGITADQVINGKESEIHKATKATKPKLHRRKSRRRVTKPKTKRNKRSINKSSKKISIFD
jgi:hypothetical protein